MKYKMLLPYTHILLGLEKNKALRQDRQPHTHHVSIIVYNGKTMYPRAGEPAGARYNTY